MSGAGATSGATLAVGTALTCAGATAGLATTGGGGVTGLIVGLLIGLTIGLLAGFGFSTASDAGTGVEATGSGGNSIAVTTASGSTLPARCSKPFCSIATNPRCSRMMSSSGTARRMGDGRSNVAGKVGSATAMPITPTPRC